jgi:hypothetical protein
MKINKFLSIIVVGKDSLHNRWVSNDRIFDIALIHYDDTEIDYSNVEYYLKIKGQKYNIIKKFIESNLDIFEKYEYIWLPDNDIEISVVDINSLFLISKEKDLYLSQPSMSGYISHNITSKKTNDIRYTRFVEVLAPLFKNNILLKLYNTFDENESSWGYDYLWPFLLGYPEMKIAILDQINMVHIKPVGGNYSRFKKHPRIEMNELIKKYKIK